MKTVFSLIIICCFWMLNAYSQTQDKIGVVLPAIVPPSPVAASLGRYGQYSVTDGAGNPNIAIPLYEIKTARLSLPISISYQGTGIRIDERASWVGLGWALNCGGVVTRAVKGTADESTYGFLNRNLPTIEEIYTDGQYTNLTSYTSNIFDTQPDFFFYNVSGNAGKFIIKRDGKIYSIPRTMDRISAMEGLSAFEILDEKGNIYTFMDKEYTGTVWPRKTQQDGTYSCSSWYLSSIMSADKSDTIKFTYASDRNEVDRIKVQSEQVSDYEGHIRDTSSYVNTNYTIRLKQIDFKGGKVTFILKDRLDAESSGLDRIDVYQKVNNSYAKLKSFSFKTNYFQATTGSGKDKFRLRLDSVLCNDKSDLKVQKYAFDYNNIPLPPVHSNAQDYWGYYNGKTNNFLLIPTTTLYYGLYGPYTIGGADRESSAEHILAGSLQKITYPTGGYTTFLFEPHVYLAATKTTTETPKSFSCAASGNNASDLIYREVTFTVNSELNILAQVDMFISDHDNDFYDYSKVPKAGLFDVTSGSVVVELNHRGDPAVSKQQSGSYYLTNGHQYKLYAQFYGPITNRATISCSFKETTTVDTSLIKRGAGIRIANISSYDLDNHKLKETKYKYSTKTGEEYGLLRTPESLIKLNSVEKEYSYKDPGGTPHSYPGINFSNTSLFELATLFGSYVNYEKIEEIETNNGKTVRQYDVVTDDIERAYFDFSAPWLISSNDWKSGRQIREDIYSESLGQYSMIQSTVDSFVTEESMVETGLDISQNKVWLNWVPTDLQAYGWFGMKERKFKTGSKRLVNRKVTHFSSAGIIQTEERKYYLSSTHLYPTRIVKLGSKSDSTIALFKFAFDKSNLNDPVPQSAEISAIDTLIKRNIIGSPIEIEVYNNSSFVKKERVLHKNWSSRIVAPEFILSKGDQGAAVEKRIQFHSYDAFGNILQQSKQDDVPEAYLWGYGSQYPVAKVLGASYPEVSSLVDQNVIQNPSSDTQLRNELNKIRTNLTSPKALVTTYTYSPLLGITSETNFQGITTFYEYDDYGRLRVIKDMNGKILKQYDYNYQKSITQ